MCIIRTISEFIYRILSRGILYITLRTNSTSNLSLSINYDLSSVNNISLLYAAFVLIVLYIMIIFDVIIHTHKFHIKHVFSLIQIFSYSKKCFFKIVFYIIVYNMNDFAISQVVHRALAAMLASTMSIAILAVFDQVLNVCANIQHICVKLY